MRLWTRRHGARSSFVVIGLVAVMVVAAAGTGVASTPRAAASTDPGIGSKEALASPNCDPTTKRIKIYYYAAPPCVKPWKDGADNGGSTAQGVTKDSIKVAVLYATNPRSANGGPSNLNQATGGEGGQRAAWLDAGAMMDSFSQLWGRKVDWEFVAATGTDDTAARADAVKVAALKPFTVFDNAAATGDGGGPVFLAALKGKVPVVNTLDPSRGNDRIVANAAEWSGKALAGRTAKWAGDESMHSKKRVFGVIYPSGPAGVNIANFTKEFAKYGGKVTTAVGYDFGTDTAAAAQEQAPTLIAKLKAAGVTTVVNFADGLSSTPAFMKAATSQDFKPEWVVTGGAGMSGNGIDSYQDINVVAALAPTDQMEHAFGLIWFNPYTEGFTDPYLAAFRWYWGKDKGTLGALPGAIPLYSALQAAGPNLTAETYRKGLASTPPIGGAYSNAVSTLEVNYRVPAGLPAPRASALGWWSPTTEAPSQITGKVQKGAYMYLDGGKRYIGGKFPKGEPDFFEPSKAIAFLQEVPANEVQPDYPCHDCPSNGGGPAPATP